MTDRRTAATPELQPGDIYVYSHDNGAIFLLEEGGRSRLVTLDEAMAVAEGCHAAGCRVVAAADDATAARDVLERIRARGVPVVDFDAAQPAHAWPNGTTALIEAAAVGANHILDDLIARGADVNHRDDSGSTALHHAAAHGNLHAVDALVAAGADLDHVSDRGFTPHMAAMATRELATAQRLATLGADTDRPLRGETRFSANHYGTMLVWAILPLGPLVVGTAILWPPSVLKILGILAILAAYVRFLYPPRVFWTAGGIPRRLDGAMLTLRRFTGRLWEIDLRQVTTAAVGGTGRSTVLGARWLLLAHPDGRAVSQSDLAALHVPSWEVDELAPLMERVVVVPAEAAQRDEVLLAVGNILSQRGVDLSATLRQQLADARAARDSG